MCRRGALALVCAPGLVFASLWAQLSAQAPQRLEFDVASVKINKDDGNTNDRRGGIIRTPGGLTARNAPFVALVEMAFQTRQIDFEHVPATLRAEHFDILAKASAKITGDQYWDMLRALLEDRFKLTYHRQTNEAQIYALVMRKKGADMGPKLRRSEDPNCPANPDSTAFCGVSPAFGRLIGKRVPMARLAQELSGPTGRPVLDRTELTGSFDFELTWTPDDFRTADGRPKYVNGNLIDPSGPSVFQAVQEQLGLKLEPARGPVETIVIDSAQSPEEN